MSSSQETRVLVRWRQTMSWINKRKRVWRVAILVLLLVAIMGPWTYTSDGVPPAAWCANPNILLENGSCVGLVSGAEVITFMTGAFLSMSVGLVTGATVLPDRAREYLGVFLFMILLLLFLLPFFTTLLLIWGRDSRRLRIFLLIAWGMAAILSLLPVVSGLVLRLDRSWGIWLYIGSAVSALILEVLALVTGRRLNPG
jgi:hypothetical protein